MSSGPVVFSGRRVQASSPLPMNDQPASTDTANSTSEKPARASVRISVRAPHASPPSLAAPVRPAKQASADPPGAGGHTQPPDLDGPGTRSASSLRRGGGA